MKQIPLTQGKYTLVDDQDFEVLNEYKWSVYFSNSRKPYARRGTQIGGRNGPYKHISMSRFLMGLSTGEKQVVDHINGDTLDNRRCNLRIATQSQNLGNQRVQSRPKSSRFKGVSFAKREKKWVAHFRNKHIGYFRSEIEAAEAYDQIAFRHFKQFAHLNFPS